MPFCPKCRSEYREGFAACKTCGDVPLVPELPKIEELRAEDLANTAPVGFATGEVSRPMELEDGRVVDLLRVFMLGQASEVERSLYESGTAAIIVPIAAGSFPDDNQRFEVRVRTEDHERAEAFLRQTFIGAVAAETDAEVGETDAETCPACGSHVPLDVEECPDCGLNVGGA